MMDCDVVVIGGGPIGCAVARDVAAAGFAVLVVEEHSRTGEPLQCAGLISPRTLALSHVSHQVVQNKLNGALIHAPGGQVLDLSSDQVYALAVDRVAFDRDLAAQAVAVGVTLLKSTRATGLSLIPDGVRVQLQSRREYGREGSVTCRLVIGADGQRSLVSCWLGLGDAGERVSLYAAEVSLPGRDDTIVDIFLGEHVAPGWFGWVIPVGPGRARVGVGARRMPRRFFQLLVERYSDVFEGISVLQSTSGFVRLGLLPRTYGDRALLVGDAACHVKPISGGGLYLGLEAAQICAATAVAALKVGDCSKDFLARYQLAWEEKIGSEILCGLHHREIFLGLSDQEMDTVIACFNNSYWRRLILKYGDLDYHSVLARKLALAPSWARHFVIKGMKVLLNFETSINIL